MRISLVTTLLAVFAVMAAADVAHAQAPTSHRPAPELPFFAEPWEREPAPLAVLRECVAAIRPAVPDPQRDEETAAVLECLERLRTGRLPPATPPAPSRGPNLDPRRGPPHAVPVDPPSVASSPPARSDD